MSQSIVRTSGLLAAFMAPVAIASAALTFTQDKLGNVFLTSETVTIPVAGTGTGVQWVITDYFGSVVKGGSATFSGGSTVIGPNLGKPGFFELVVTEKDGSTTLSTKSTTFAVVTPVDVATMASSKFGVQTHFAQSHNPDLLPLLARAGIAHVRDEQYWNSIETAPGVFNYPSKFTTYMGALSTQAISPLITLDWSNQFYDYDAGQFTGPYTDTGRAGYANYALNVLNRYGSQIKQVEVWNEYNAGTFIKGPATADKDLYYYYMLKKVYETIKPGRPDVTVLAGGTVPVAHGFLRDIFVNGAMPYLDAVSVHPYMNAEDAELEFSELRNLIKQYNGNVEKPIWATEFSLSVSNPAEQPEGARHLVRIATQMLNQNVARMYYYLGQDDGNFPHRGLFSSATGSLGKYAPHPSYVAYAVLIRQLHGWTPAGRMTGTRPGTYIYKFVSGTTQRYVLWSTTPTTVHLNSTAANMSQMDIMGVSATRSTVGGKFTVQLGVNPIYITGPVTSVTEVFNPVVADSVADYGKTQGGNGWTYGYANLASGAAYSTGNFQPMTWGIWTTYNYRWKGNGTYNFITSQQAHPNGSWAIRRWTSTVAGTVELNGELQRGSGGDGTRLRLFVNGVEKLNQFIAPSANLAYEVPNVTVAVGSKVDLAIVQEGDSTNDATTATMRVSRVLSSPVVLTQGSLTDYSAQTGTPGAATVLAGGVALELTGNIWRKHPFSYNVTA
ncbi:MAG TPA: glycosyl hydrolase, partial [Rariglobus sp.]